jgi:DNA-binding Lrp family transcriptional regulator
MTDAEIMYALSDGPLTSLQVSVLLGCKLASVASRLSKLGNYGIIDRIYKVVKTERSHGGSVQVRTCMWSIKDEKNRQPEKAKDYT